MVQSESLSLSLSPPSHSLAPTPSLSLSLAMSCLALSVSISLNLALLLLSAASLADLTLYGMLERWVGDSLLDGPDGFGPAQPDILKSRPHKTTLHARARTRAHARTLTHTHTHTHTLKLPCLTRPRRGSVSPSARAPVLALASPCRGRLDLLPPRRSINAHIRRAP